MSKQLIAVVMGGPSTEHEVSINSGQAVLENLDTTKYEALKVFVSKQEEWFFADEKDSLTTAQALKRLKDQAATIFIALHGSYGEDGVIQAKFEAAGIPFTGSGVAASKLAMDKALSDDLYRTNHLTIPRTETYERPDVDKVLKDFSVPMVIKPVHQGSSVGVHIVRKTEDVAAAIAGAFSYDTQIMVQEYIKGREIACGVIEKNGSTVALPPTEITPLVADFFSYEAKYTEGGSKEVTPAPMGEAVIDKIQEIAVIAHNVIGCSTYSRTDMIVKDGLPYVIETNTLPGLTKFSLLPQQAKAAKISFSELLDLIIADTRV